MDFAKIAITGGTLVGYALAVTGINTLTKNAANSITTKNANKKIEALSEEERTDEALASIINKETYKNNTLAALVTTACSIGLGAASIAIVDNTVGMDDTTTNSDDADVAAASMLNPYNFYFRNYM